MRQPGFQFLPRRLLKATSQLRHVLPIVVVVRGVSPGSHELQTRRDRDSRSTVDKHPGSRHGLLRNGHGSLGQPGAGGRIVYAGPQRQIGIVQTSFHSPNKVYPAANGHGPLGLNSWSVSERNLSPDAPLVGGGIVDTDLRAVAAAEEIELAIHHCRFGRSERGWRIWQSGPAVTQRAVAVKHDRYLRPATVEPSPGTAAGEDVELVLDHFGDSPLRGNRHAGLGSPGIRGRIVHEE